MLLPAVQSVRAAARRVECANNVRQLGLGLANFESSFMVYPQAGGPRPKGLRIPESERDYGSVQLWIMPFVEANNLFNQVISATSPVQLNNNGNPQWRGFGSNEQDVEARTAEVFLCPSRVTCPNGYEVWTNNVDLFSVTNYVANVQALHHFFPGQPNNKQYQKVAGILDGTSQTVAFAERFNSTKTLASNPNSGGTWARTAFHGVFPNDKNPIFAWNDPEGLPEISPPQIRPSVERGTANPCNPFTTQTSHQIMNVALFDGSVQAIPGSIDDDTWFNLILPDDGQVIAEF